MFDLCVCVGRYNRVSSSGRIQEGLLNRMCNALQVKFVDWGNGETVSGSNVREVEPALAALPEQAALYSLAYLKVLPLCLPNSHHHHPRFRVCLPKQVSTRAVPYLYCAHRVSMLPCALLPGALE